MLTLNDGRNELWQWDTGRKLTVDTDCSQVHFSNKVFGRSIDVDVVDGLAIIPDILLQTDKELMAWAFVGTAENGYTKISKVFKVNKRNKPADYVFTPTDQTTLEELVERLEKIEKTQDPDAIKNAVDDYLSSNPTQIDEKDPTVPDWAKQTSKPKYTAKEVGAVAAVNGISPDESGNVQIKVPDSVEGAVLYTEQELTEEQKAQARANIGLSVVEPAEEDIPKVFFGGALPQTKTDTIMSFRYISKTEDISGYCKTKAHGNSSMSYPKKNQTVKLYKDAECTEKLKVDFKRWGKQNKFCFKANWVDLTHARNIVSARMWGDVVKSRSNYAEIPELLRTSPNQGAVDGFPVKVYANGVYQGRYTINIPKDAWMANMDDELDTHCILCGESSDSAQFKAEAVIDGTDWSDEVHDTVPTAILTRWNEIISFVKNSTDDEFVSSIGDYFDVQSLIDYYLFGEAICNFDGFQKNQLYLTYDGQKWFASAYDMDSTFGLWWTGEEFLAYDYPIGMADNNILYSRLKALFSDDLKTRWHELRTSVLTVDNIINQFERFTDICPPWLVCEDYAETTANGAYTGIPSAETNNIQQIRDYLVNRLNWLDKDKNDYLVYSADGIVLNGDTAIRTGVCLFDVPKASTVFIDLTADTQPYNSALLWTHQEVVKDPPTTGLTINTAGVEWITVHINGKERNLASSWLWRWDRTRAIVITTTSDGVIGTCKLKYDTGLIEEFAFPEMNFAPTKGDICIGAKCANENEWDKFTGTVNSIRIWERQLSDEEIAELFDGVVVS